MFSLRSLLYFNIQEKLHISCSRGQDLNLGLKKKNIQGVQKVLEIICKDLCLSAFLSWRKGY